jgi:hypothetical protein
MLEHVDGVLVVKAAEDENRHTTFPRLLVGPRKKSETRISKSETNPSLKDETQTWHEAWFGTFGFRFCFGFRDSSFGFFLGCGCTHLIAL